MIHDDNLEWRIRRRLAEIQVFLGSAECTDETAVQIDQKLEAATMLISELRNPVGGRA